MPCHCAQCLLLVHALMAALACILVQDYALTVTSAEHLTIANMTLFGTTVNATGYIPYMTLNSVLFLYPTFGKRSLKSNAASRGTIVSAVAGSAPSPSPPSPPSPSPPPPSPPSPSPSPPPTPSAACNSCEEKYCRGLAGRGESCENCVIKHQKEFVQAGCFAKGGHRHVFLEAYCYNSSTETQTPPPSSEESSFTIYNCTWFGADGGVTLEVTGSSSTIVNNMFDSNDWTATHEDFHTGLGSYLLSSVTGKLLYNIY